MELPFRRVDGGELPLPAYATERSSGLDLRAAEDYLIQPGARVAVRTGFSLAVPPGCEGQVRMRSGVARDHGLIIPNSPGTIDEDFRGELLVLLMNLGTEPFSLQRGFRFAQLVIQRVERVRPIEVSELPPTARGEGGFGHTGVA